LDTEFVITNSVSIQYKNGSLRKEIASDLLGSVYGLNLIPSLHGP